MLMKLTDLVVKGNPERLTTGYYFTEGPVWTPDGYLFFSDIQGNTIYRYSPGSGAERYRYPSNQSNGLTVDKEGRLIACEQEARRVTRTEHDGTITVLADCYDGKRINSPNDVIVKSDGAVYFTDPRAHIIPENEIEQSCNGLYRVLLDGTVERLAEDIAYPNGLAFNPDETRLYVIDSEREQVCAFDVNADGSLRNSRVFLDLGHPQTGFFSSGPDGMAVDALGNLYVCATDGIWVFHPDGTWIGNLTTRSDQRHAEPAVNLTFGDADRKSLYVAACSSIYRFRMRVPG
jgi:gluconolactonase